MLCFADQVVSCAWKDDDRVQLGLKDASMRFLIQVRSVSILSLHLRIFFGTD